MNYGLIQQYKEVSKIVPLTGVEPKSLSMSNCISIGESLENEDPTYWIL